MSEITGKKPHFYNVNGLLKYNTHRVLYLLAILFRIYSFLFLAGFGMRETMKSSISILTFSGK